MLNKKLLIDYKYELPYSSCMFLYGSKYSKHKIEYIRFYITLLGFKKHNLDKLSLARSFIIDNSHYSQIRSVTVMDTNFTTLLIKLGYQKLHVLSFNINDFDSDILLNQYLLSIL